MFRNFFDTCKKKKKQDIICLFRFKKFKKI